MHTAARWGLAAVFAVTAACTGPQGPKGDPGPPGPAGTQGPPGSGGLDGGGTVRGDLYVTGQLSADGRLLTYPRNPLVLTGIDSQGCVPFNWTGTAFGGFSHVISFPVLFGGNSVILTSLDTNGLGDNGAQWAHVSRAAPNRMSVRCDDTGSPVHWFAIDDGTFTFPLGLHLEAHATALTQQTATINFTPGFFTNPPLVFLTIESGSATANYARVVSTVTKDSFIYALSAAPAAGERLHWVAMDRGTYPHGRYLWTADFVASTCTTNCVINASLGITPNVFLTVQNANQATATTFNRLLNVTPQQFSYRVGGTAPERINYLTVLEDPTVVTF